MRVGVGRRRTGEGILVPRICALAESGLLDLMRRVWLLLDSPVAAAALRVSALEMFAPKIFAPRIPDEAVMWMVWLMNFCGGN